MQNNKPKLIVPIGLPGCGKSTWAKEMVEKESYVVHSSDQIRLELGTTADDPHKNDQKAFQIMHERVKKDLLAGKNCIYDATNLSRKNRRQFLEELTHIPCEKEALLFLVPVEVCKERNSRREGFARVPNSVYDRMLKAFNVPDKRYDGFDTIDFIAYDGGFSIPDYNHLDDFSQDNPHHTESLGDHMRLAAVNVHMIMGSPDHYDPDSVYSPNNLAYVARYHDIGKFYTKDFHNSKGEPSKEAHFYGHDNVGAYMYLLKWLKEIPSSFRKETFETALTVANVINWHMAPHTIWKQSERRRNFDREHLDPELVKAIDVLYEADKRASIPMEKEQDLEDEDQEKV